MTNAPSDAFDVVVIGGGAAGLSGALTLVRARRKVVVLDAGQPRNAPANAVHGLLGLDGTSPADLLERGRAEVTGYGGEVVSGEVETVVRGGDGFVVTVADGRTVRARRLLVATGLVDERPDIPGLWARWDRDVVHCPYCHGWEVRDQAVGVLATGPMSLHQALLFTQWTDDVTFFSRATSLTEEQSEQLAARRIQVLVGEVASLEIADNRLVGVRLASGAVVAREAVAVSPRMVARAGFLAGLGIQPTSHPMGEYIEADRTGRTAVPGVWVAGNVTDLAAQVGAAAAAGAFAATQINADLVTEDTDKSVRAMRDDEPIALAYRESAHRSERTQ
ncbi:NAD(P)/FAD-dependent oxidoreductase [Kibdelosporangium aridum]|uniref:NAD(P)/FAD-dependent oxidoreductase n=1 Tax=Kibdelosporangium aridum TaxID=2030 RepID=UPI00068B60D5